MKGLMQDSQLSLDTIFRRAEQFFPDKTVYTGGPAPTTTTYAEWAARTRRLGGVFDTLGVSSDGRVGTFAWNSGRHLELYFAAPCTGRVLHTLNIRLFPDQVVYIANHAEDEVVFVDRSLLGLFLPLLDRLPLLRHIVVMDDLPAGAPSVELPDDARFHDYEELLAAAEPVEFHVEDENQAAAMCYTSGTTGNPKGVLYSHRSNVLHAMAKCLTDAEGVCHGDRVLPAVPMFHANAWGFPYACAMMGADLIFPSRFVTPEALTSLIADERVTLAGGVPTVWLDLLRYADEHGSDLSSLRMLVCGGSAAPESLMRAFSDRHGVEMVQAWGMTETSPLASVSHAPPGLEGDAAWTARARQGRPLPLVESRIVGDDGAELPWDGETTGELEVRGPWIASEYYEDPAGDEKFHHGWLRTGDIASIDASGSIRLSDRSKDVIKSGGEWISSVDLENAIMGHPAVAECAVIAMPHERWAERPLACVVLQPGESVEPDVLKTYLVDHVAKWWLPDEIVFLDEVPKTSVGKFDKKVLRTRLADGALLAEKAPS
jgi:fatty-acyl-CoA synthase